MKLITFITATLRYFQPILSIYVLIGFIIISTAVYGFLKLALILVVLGCLCNFFWFLYKQYYTINVSTFWEYYRILQINACFLIGLPFSIIWIMSHGYSLFGMISFYITSAVCITVFPIYLWVYILKYYVGRNNQQVLSWFSPQMLLDIALCFLYISFWVLYVNVARYLRLGIDYDVYYILSYINIDLLTITLFLLPFYYIWLYPIVHPFLFIRDLLVKSTFSIVYSFHLELLQKNIYFFCTEYLYKFSYIFFSYFYVHADVYGYHQSRFRKFLFFLYKYPWIITCFIFLFVTLEIIKNAGLIHYSLYILFIYPVLYTICSFFYTLHCIDWLMICNFSDYLAKNFANPRYPFEFWKNFKFNHTELWVDVFQWDFSEEEMACIDRLSKPYLSKKRLDDLSCHKLASRIEHKYPWISRVKVGYRTMTGIRWVHTTTGVTQTLHSHVGFFARTLGEHLWLINSNWKHIHAIQAGIKRISNSVVNPFPLKESHIYARNMLPNKEYPHLINFIEANTLRHFRPLQERGVGVQTYATEITFENKLPQKQPDIILTPTGSGFLEKRVLGIDVKSFSFPGIGSNYILIDISSERYQKTIDLFSRHLLKTTNLSAEQKHALDNLKLTCNNFEDHQLCWLSTSHLFGQLLPPLRLPSTIHTADMHPDIIQAIHDGGIRMIRISSILYERKLPVKKEPRWKDIEDYFDGSELQAILGS